MMDKSDNGELNSSIFGSNTSDPNNSILKKVTKRVSGLFPTSLTKWFGPSEGNQSTVRRRESIDDENDEENAQLQQPPKKRAKQTSDAEFNTLSSFTVTSTPLVNSRTSYERSSTRNEAPVANGDDKSDSGDSTNGGSLLNQPSTSKASPSKSLNSSLNSSRSLFSEHSLSRQRQCMSNRRPSFSASTFGSPSFVDRTLSTKRAVNSPFYSGRTTYGGASAYRRSRIIFPRDESTNLAIKNSVDIKPAKDSSSSSDSVNLSRTARRILDTLEHFSTPVLDAKKIPNINRQSCDTKSANLRHTPYSKSKVASNKELLVPTVPDLIKMKLKEKLQDSTVQVRKVATTSKSVLNTEYSIRTIEEPKSQKHVNKMKSKIASVRERKDVEDTVDAVKLPDVKLPITTLPKFDFTLPPPKAVITKPAVSEAVKPMVSLPTSKPLAAVSTIPSEFNFTKPKFVCEKPRSHSTINNFKFSEPFDPKSKSNMTFIVPNSSTAPRRKIRPKNNGQNNVEFTLQPPTQFVSGSVMDVLGKPEKKPESDNLLDKFKPAAGTWECGACMIRNIPSATRCVACETMRESPKKVEEKKTYGFGNQFKMAADSWECSACMVRNNNSSTKCVACTTPKPGNKPIAPVVSEKNITSGFGDKFKPASNTWECSACMIRNKQEAVKCVACETPDPKAKSDLKSNEVKTTGFGEFMKKQQSNWECPSCMVRNPPEKNICACCEAPKPGEKQEFKFGAQPTSTTQFKFGIDKSESAGFKFGVDKADTTPTTFSFGVKPADKTVDTKVATTSNGPAPVTSGFTFGIPAAAKPETKADTSKPEITEASSSNKSVVTTNSNQMAFKFSPPVTTSATDVSNNSTSTISSSFSFGVPASATKNATSKPMFSFGATSTNSVASTTSVDTTSPVVTSTTSKALPTSTIFSNLSAPAKPTPAFTAPAVVAVTTTPAATTSITSSSTFAFVNPVNTDPKPIAFGSDNKLPVPQFNFGSGGLPFNPVYGAAKTTAATTSTPTATPSFGATVFSKKPESTPSFGGPTNLPGFSDSSAKASATFSFKPNEQKAPFFNFGAPNAAMGTTGPPQANMFGFNGNKTDKPAAAFGTGNPAIFGEPAQSSTTPQNGGFNFGSNSVPVNFNFGGGSNPPASTPVFGFGSSQAGTGSAMAAPAPAAAAPGIFAFGAGNPRQPQTQTPTFSPDIKPNFNFTGGNMPSFSAQGSGGAMPQRKIRKAVRRTQPR